MADRETLLKILDLGRWAPSGDNTQPWAFEIVDGDHIAVHGHDTREWCLYDFDGHASHIAHGALLETLRIAATRFGLQATWSLRQGSSDSAPVFDIKLETVAGLEPDPLVSHIEPRCVQRRPMKLTPLTDAQREALVNAVGPAYSVRFFESFAERQKIGRLLWDSAYIRLTCPEAYKVHKEIIEWGVRFSEDRIPEQAVGVDPLTGRLMRWVLGSWGRVAFFNRFLFGTVAPRIQLDYLPALRCAAHVLIRPVGRLETVSDYVEAGAAMQRLWVTVSALGLFLQPEMTPLIFRWYVRHDRVFSSHPGLDDAARAMARDFETLAGATTTEDFGFFCRVGSSSMPASRSIRKPIGDLMVAPR